MVPAWTVLLATTAMACSAPPGEQVPVVSVQTAVAAVRPITEVVAADAVLHPLAQAAIVPKITAPVERFAVNRGARVRKGQLLAVLEHRDLAAAVAEDEGLLAQAEAAEKTTREASVPADVQKAELDVTTSKDALDVQQKVYDDRKALLAQGAVPQRQVETAGVALAQARSEYAQAAQRLDAVRAVTRAAMLRQAEAQVSAARGQLEAARAQLSYATIVSPIDGVIADRPFYAGEMATAGTPLLTVMDTAAVVARAPVPAAEAAPIAVGAPAALDVPGADGPVAGTVTVVSPALDPSSTTVQVWIEAPNPGGRLRPGASVRASITARTVPDAIVVPAGAILTDDEGAHTVMVLGKDGKAHARAVETGIRQGDAIQITRGLAAGETVVTTGAYGLPDGTAVKVEPAPAASGGER
jgi:multidrug efflux pump subunit AcrA (membrane-fusion protein)